MFLSVKYLPLHLEVSIQLYITQNLVTQTQCETFLPFPLISVQLKCQLKQFKYNVSDHKDKARVNSDCFALFIKDHQTQDTTLAREAPCRFLPALQV